MNFYSKPKTLALLVTISCISPIFCKKNINDFSNLNKTVVNKIYYPSTEREIQHIIKKAKRLGKKVPMLSLKGYIKDELVYFAPKGARILGITFIRGQDSPTANQHEFDRLLQRCRKYFGAKSL